MLKAPLNRNRSVSHLRARTVLISHNVLIANLRSYEHCCVRARKRGSEWRWNDWWTCMYLIVSLHATVEVTQLNDDVWPGISRDETQQLKQSPISVSCDTGRHQPHLSDTTTTRLSNYFTSVQFTYAPVHATKHRRSKRYGIRSSGTVHTSAKARLTSVAIRIQIRDPDRHQNLIIYSLTNCQPSLKISCKSVRQFLRKVANRQTDRQTNNDENITFLAEVKIT